MKKKKEEKSSIKYYEGVQVYKGIPLYLIVRRDYETKKAKRFMIGDPQYNQNVWIPNQYLTEDGQILSNANIDFVIKRAFYEKKLLYAKIDINPLNWR